MPGVRLRTPAASGVGAGWWLCVGAYGAALAAHAGAVSGVAWTSALPGMGLPMPAASGVGAGEWLGVGARGAALAAPAGADAGAAGASALAGRRAARARWPAATVSELAARWLLGARPEGRVRTATPAALLAALRRTRGRL